MALRGELSNARGRERDVPEQEVYQVIVADGVG